MMSPIPSQSNNEIKWLRDWIETHTGIAFPEHKMSLLEQRLILLRNKLNCQSNAEIIRALEVNQNSDVVKGVIDIATTNHTHFFREMDTLLFFINTILGECNYVGKLRIWSAASSSGEELYTVILLMIEKFGLTAVRNQYYFLGTDVNVKVVEEAEKGVYSTQRLSDIKSDILSRWFTPMGLDSWSISAEVKQLCLFRRLNLMKTPWPFSRLFHVVFLRNVLYYFEPNIQQKILQNIYNVTEKGGWLITSVTEPLNNIKSDWKRVRSGVYRKE